MHIRVRQIVAVFACLLASSSSALADDRLTSISENLFLFQDTCNVYVIRSGNEAVLIDFGSGAVLEQLPKIGVERVAWVLHTHYHRDQCQGDHVLAARGVKLAVPADQAKYFADAEATWNETVIYNNYGYNWDFFRPVRSVSVDKSIAPGDVFQWRDTRFGTLPNIGHTKDPGLTYVAEIDGQEVAFTGDLIHSPGKLWTYHNLQWRYHDVAAGTAAALSSLELLQASGPDMLAPSHGAIMKNPSAAIDATIRNLAPLPEFLTMRKARKNPPKLARTKIYPHVVHDRTSFFLIADDGHTLVYDFRLTGSQGRQMIEGLREKHGLSEIDLVIASHYHDDHVSGIRFLQQTYGCEVWVHECMADVLTNPQAYNIPCLAYGPTRSLETPRIDRVLKEEETFEWKGWRFTVCHFPGQTEYHQGMFVEMDGQRMIFVGDSTYRPDAGTPFRGGLFQTRNYCLLGPHVGYMKCADMLERFRPSVAMASHVGAIPIGESDIRTFREWAEKLEPTFKPLIARENPNFGTDPNWVAYYPYRVAAEAGERIAAEVRIRNHASQGATAVVTPVLRDGWKVDPPSRSVTIPAKSTGSVAFELTVADSPDLPLRTVVTANVEYDGVDFGEIAEMVIDKRSMESHWPKWETARIQKARAVPPPNTRGNDRKSPADRRSKTRR